jgi:hypothetical protein
VDLIILCSSKLYISMVLLRSCNVSVCYPVFPDGTESAGLKGGWKEQHTGVENIGQVVQGVLRVTVRLEILMAVRLPFRANCG